MSRNVRNSKRSASRKRRGANFEKDGFEPRRSGRITTNAFASDRIANKRLTIPVGFFTGGVKSAASKKTDPTLNDRSKLILKENLHALLHNLTEEGDDRFGRATSAVQEDFPAILPKKKAGKTYGNVSSYYFHVSAKSRRETEKRAQGATPDLQEDITYSQTRFLTQTEPRPTPNRNHRKELVTANFDSTSTTTAIGSPDPAKFRLVNCRFGAKLQAQLRAHGRSRKREYVLRVKLSARAIDDIFDGVKARPGPTRPSRPDTAVAPAMSTKRCLSDDYDELPEVPLVPQSQWVYSTPDKRIVKKFVFEDNTDKFLPAVIHTTKRNKVLYDIKNEVAQAVNLSRFKDESVPIDKRFLNAICQTTATTCDAELTNAKKKQKVSEGKENFFDFKVPPEPDFKFEPNKEDFNVFLLNTEETIDIKPPSVIIPDIPMDVIDTESTGDTFNLFETDPYEKAPVDYRHQLLLATQRPSKTVKRVPKRHMLKGKSLSFENTPPRSKTPGFEPKKLELSKSFEECLDEFESQFNILGEGSSGTTMPTLQDFCVSTFKFYPRRNFDFKQ